MKFNAEWEWADRSEVFGKVLALIRRGYVVEIGLECSRSFAGCSARRDSMST
jgi:hypothetical protein